MRNLSHIASSFSLRMLQIYVIKLCSLLQATAELMEQDPSIWCASSWNDNGLAALEWNTSKLVGQAVHLHAFEFYVHVRSNDANQLHYSSI